MQPLTNTERVIWCAAFARCQPQPIDVSSAFESKQNAKYWAAAAVFVFRGAKENPRREEAEEMYKLAGGR
jgi:hypothetical protein